MNPLEIRQKIKALYNDALLSLHQVYEWNRFWKMGGSSAQTLMSGTVSTICHKTHASLEFPAQLNEVSDVQHRSDPSYPNEFLNLSPLHNMKNIRMSFMCGAFSYWGGNIYISTVCTISVLQYQLQDRLHVLSKNNVYLCWFWNLCCALKTSI